MEKSTFIISYYYKLFTKKQTKIILSLLQDQTGIATNKASWNKIIEW